MHHESLPSLAHPLHELEINIYAAFDSGFSAASRWWLLETTEQVLRAAELGPASRGQAQSREKRVK
jgi:hypothetical protein